MATIVYTLKKKKDTEELHLFEAEMNTAGTECTPKEKSVCREMDKSESSSNKFTCEDEKTARIKCAEIGRAVCGTCVSHLYATFKK